MHSFYKLREFPFVGVIIPFCLGIVSGYFSPILPFYGYILLAIYFLLSLILASLIPQKSARVLIILTLIFFNGFTLIQSKLTTPDIDPTRKMTLSGEIVSVPKKQSRYTKFIVESNSIKDNPLKIVTYIFSEDNLNLNKGDIIVFKSKLKRIENRENQTFDYKNYMKRQYVNHIAFVNKSDYKELYHEKFSFNKFCTFIRKKIIDKLQESGIKEPELGLLKAMLLGEKNNLDKDIKKDYIAAGAIHLLAISGLHTGIIYILITFILSYVIRLRSYDFSYMFLSIGLLWFYAIITGLPPSVLRATIILSFIILGKYMQRGVNIYNGIAFSAFIILACDPGCLLSPGFQLSYAAYTSIVYLYPRLYKLLVIKNRLLNSIWQLSVVSFSAQLGTLPLSVMHFGHIYYYSLLTNLCISCFIPIIIYGGISSLIISCFIPGETYISIALSYIIKIVNYIIDTIAHLPGAISEKINLSVIDTILIYFLLAGISTMIWHRKRNLIFFILASTIMLYSLKSFDKSIKSIQREHNQENIR